MYILRRSVVLLLATFAAALRASALRDVRAFQLPPGLPLSSLKWPEEQVPSVRAKPPNGLCFSGGGSRSYIGAMGVLRALTDLGLMGHVRYLGGASGGGWAASAYTYFQPNQPFAHIQVGEDRTVKTTYSKSETSASSDEILLGNITFPTDMTESNMNYIAPQCLRGSVSSNVISNFVKEWLKHGFKFHKGFVAGVHQNYLIRAGIPSPYDPTPKLFSYDKDTVASIKARNPSLANDFILPPSGRPVMTIGFTLLGRAQAIVGGGIESFAFSGHQSGSQQRLLSNQTVGSLSDVTLPSEVFTLSHAAATGGWFAADEISSQLGPLGPIANDLFGLDANYFSPAFPPGSQQSEPGQPFSFGDAGITENLHLISMLRRTALQRFVIITNSNVPMSPKSKWDPTVRPPTTAEMDDTIPNYFGVKVDKPDAPWDYSKNHVFDTSQFTAFCVAMQTAIASGNGGVVAMELKVVENSYWGIEGGRTVNVTWYLNSRVYNWEEMLPPFLKKDVVPAGPKDPTNLPSEKSKFPTFPHYPTSKLQLNDVQSNLLANMMGWVVLKNQDLFCRGLGVIGGCPNQ
eukprot:g6303.t1